MIIAQYFELLFWPLFGQPTPLFHYLIPLKLGLGRFKTDLEFNEHSELPITYDSSGALSSSCVEISLNENDYCTLNPKMMLFSHIFAADYDIGYK